MPLFVKKNGKLLKLKSYSAGKEKELQKIVEENMLEVLDMHFLETEYPTTFGGRIDTLAIDKFGAPIIIEYKRHKDDNVINQALSYLKWLQAQKVEFLEMLVQRKLGKEIAENLRIDWKNPRIICIAESYSKFDIDTVEVIPMRIELFKYRFYEDNIFSLEPLNASEQKSSDKVAVDNTLKTPIDHSVDALLKKAPDSIVEIFKDIRSKIFEIDENIIEKATSLYIAYRVANSFSEIWLYKKQLKIYLRPIEYKDPEKKVEKISAGYKWKLDKLIIVKELSEVDYALSMIEQSYQDVL